MSVVVIPPPWIPDPPDWDDFQAANERTKAMLGISTKRGKAQDRFRSSKQVHELNYIKYGQKSTLMFNNYQNLLRASKIIIPFGNQETPVYYQNWREIGAWAWKNLPAMNLLRRNIETFRRANRATGGRAYIDENGSIQIAPTA